MARGDGTEVQDRPLRCRHCRQCALDADLYSSGESDLVERCERWLTGFLLQQADCILLVADGGSDPGLGEYEKLLVGMKTTARKELILLHSERNVSPGTTRPWLKVSCSSIPMAPGQR